jgi:hypothetical protein
MTVRRALSLDRQVVRKPHKYSAVRTEVDGVSFPSKAEARHYGVLKLLEKAGEISDLELQPRFPLLVPVKGRSNVYEQIGVYVADFRYREGPNGVLRIVDVKGVKTAVYRLKKKHVEIQYGLTITEVR